MTDGAPEPRPARRIAFLVVALVAAALVAVLALWDSGDAEPAVMEGVVIGVDGGLQGIDGFEILVSDGTTYALTPAPGLLFDDGAPLSHLQAHLVSGQAVSVGVEYPDDGGIRAVSIRDAGSP